MSESLDRLQISAICARIRRNLGRLVSSFEGSATAEKSVRDFEFTERFQDFSKDFRFQPIQQKISDFSEDFKISAKISAKISDFARISAEISRFHVISGEISRFQDPFQISAEISW